MRGNFKDYKKMSQCRQSLTHFSMGQVVVIARGGGRVVVAPGSRVGVQLEGGGLGQVTHGV